MCHYTPTGEFFAKCAHKETTHNDLSCPFTYIQGEGSSSRPLFRGNLNHESMLDAHLNIILREADRHQVQQPRLYTSIGEENRPKEFGDIAKGHFGSRQGFRNLLRRSSTMISVGRGSVSEIGGIPGTLSHPDITESNRKHLEKEHSEIREVRKPQEKLLYPLFAVTRKSSSDFSDSRIIQKEPNEDYVLKHNSSNALNHRRLDRKYEKRNQSLILQIFSTKKVTPTKPPSNSKQASEKFKRGHSQRQEDDKHAKSPLRNPARPFPRYPLKPTLKKQFFRRSFTFLSDEYNGQLEDDKQPLLPSRPRAEEDDIIGPLDVESARSLIYKKNCNLVPMSSDRRHTAPSLSPTCEERPPKRHFSSLRGSFERVFARRTNAQKEEKVSENDDIADANAISIDANAGIEPRPLQDAVPLANNQPESKSDRTSLAESEFYHRNSHTGKIHRERSVLVKQGSKEVLEEIYMEMNRKTAGRRKVFVSWGFGVDKIIPKDGLRESYSVNGESEPSLGSWFKGLTIRKKVDKGKGVARD